MPDMPLDPHPLLSAAEVSSMLSVDAGIVTGWATSGRLRSVYTASGQQRFLKADILHLHPELVEGNLPPQTQAEVIVPAESSHSAAAAVAVAQAVLDSHRTDELLTRVAVVTTSNAVQAAAQTTAESAERAGEDRAFAAAVAAELVARAAAHDAQATQARTDSAVAVVNAAAKSAARAVVQASRPGPEGEESLKAARQVANMVESAAETLKQHAEEGAELVVANTERAATQVSLIVAAEDLSLKQEVARTAADVSATASEAARELAALIVKRRRHQASLARDAEALLKLSTRSD